jgi:hypothetical protein
MTHNATDKAGNSSESTASSDPDPDQVILDVMTPEAFLEALKLKKARPSEDHGVTPICHPAPRTR